MAAQVGDRPAAGRRSGHQPHVPRRPEHPDFTHTLVTRAFSGRYGRGLENQFTRLFDLVLLGYPEVNQMTAPILAAAIGVDDPNGTNLWAGTAYRQARSAPAERDRRGARVRLASWRGSDRRAWVIWMKSHGDFTRSMQQWAGLTVVR